MMTSANTVWHALFYRMRRPRLQGWARPCAGCLSPRLDSMGSWRRLCHDLAFTQGPATPLFGPESTNGDISSEWVGGGPYAADAASARQ